MDQRRQVRPELDQVVLPQVRGRRFHSVYTADTRQLCFQTLPGLIHDNLEDGQAAEIPLGMIPLGVPRATSLPSLIRAMVSHNMSASSV